MRVRVPTVRILDSRTGRYRCYELLCIPSGQSRITESPADTQFSDQSVYTGVATRWNDRTAVFSEEINPAGRRTRKPLHIIEVRQLIDTSVFIIGAEGGVKTR